MNKYHKYDEHYMLVWQCCGSFRFAKGYECDFVDCPDRKLCNSILNEFIEWRQKNEIV